MGIHVGPQELGASTPGQDVVALTVERGPDRVVRVIRDADPAMAIFERAPTPCNQVTGKLPIGSLVLRCVAP